MSALLHFTRGSSTEAVTRCRQHVNLLKIHSQLSNGASELGNKSHYITIVCNASLNNKKKSDATVI